MMGLQFDNGGHSNMDSLFTHWSHNINPSSKGCIFNHVILFTCWSLWKARNNKRFRDIKQECSQIIASIGHLVLLQHWAFPYKAWQLKGNSYFLNLIHSNKSVCKLQPDIKVAWKKPDLGYVKLNFDGVLTDDKAAGGGIIRDSDGNFIYAYHCIFDCDNAIIAEILAAIFGINKCKDKGYNCLHLDLTSTNIASWIRDDNDIGWDFLPYIHQLKNLIHDMQVKTTYIVNDINQVAHFLSRINYTDVNFDTFDAVPVDGQNLIINDKMGLENTRRI
ncbi:Putative ribonuclease H protein [Apostasia shenzhenica]|uniref:Ribonuclease H protein n=1 Tax=Apostasia shenzhenica TaxID=1088818 RepID=A0A2I0A9M2_9ASPA|nr:Putative ribonuclease H protein [Apostasia shenzhenica]